MGLLTTPVDIERIKEAIIKIVPEENNTYLLRTAIVLTGFLEIEETVPLLIDVINESRCDDYDVSLIFKSLIMMNVEDKQLLQWFEDAAESNQENYYFMLLHARQLSQVATLESAQKAFDILETIEDEDSKRKALVFLPDIHKKGVDTSSWLDFIIEDYTYVDYYNPVKAQWIKAVSTENVLKVVLDHERNSDLVIEIFCQAIAQPDSWEFLYPLLIDKKEEWLSSEIGDNLTIAYMTLLGAMGEDLASYITDTESWSRKCGAFLAEAGKDSGKDYFTFYSEEEDSDVKYAIKLVSIHKRN